MVIKLVAWTGAVLYWFGFLIIVPVSSAMILILLSGADGRGDPDHFRVLAARLQIRAYLRAIESFQRDVGRLPATDEGLRALRLLRDVSGWRGPYVDRDLAADPWGRPYIYRYDGMDLEIVSLGTDGKPGGSGFNADISSRRLNEPIPRGRLLYQGWCWFLAAILGLTVYPMLPWLFRSAGTRFLNARLRKRA